MVSFGKVRQGRFGGERCVPAGCRGARLGRIGLFCCGAASQGGVRLGRPGKDSWGRFVVGGLAGMLSSGRSGEPRQGLAGMVD